MTSNNQNNMKIKTQYTPSEAIRQVDGLDRKQLYERMDSNDSEYRVSYTPVKKKKRTERVIDASELVRVFADRFTPIEQTTSETTDNDKKQVITTETIREISALEDEVKLLKKQLSDEKDKSRLLEDTVDDLREDKKFLQKQVESHTLLLSDQRKREDELKEQLAITQQPVEAPRRILGIFPRKIS